MTRAPTRPSLSVVVVAFDLERELPITLASLSPSYQRHIAADEYEVLVVDNGSTAPVDVRGQNVRVIRIDDAPPSPAMAVNRGLAEARGDVIAVMIDGARLGTPGLLHFGRQAAGLYARAVVATLGWYLGFDYQRFSVPLGHDGATEAALLESIGWPDDGYRLFEVATMDDSTLDGWWSPISESNCLFLSRATWEELGGMDERFASPGGGLVNLDTYGRALALPSSELVVLLGEGTFHQTHGGIATGVPAESFQAKWDAWSAEYEAIRGKPWTMPAAARPPTYLGRLPEPVLERFVTAVSRPVLDRPAPLGATFDPARRSAAPAVTPVDPTVAALVERIHHHMASEQPTAAAAIARLTRARAPREPEPLRVLALLAGWLPFGRPAAAHRAEYELALGDAHRLLGEADAARTHYLAALEAAPGHVDVHLGLARLALPGADYLHWLERIHAHLAPHAVLAISDEPGSALAGVTPPTLAIGVGVDPDAVVTAPAATTTHLFREGSDAFFAAGRLPALLGGRPLEVAFLDGVRLYEHALRDFVSVERHCGSGSLVMIHDTLPLDEPTQSRVRATQFHTGDVWKLAICLCEQRPDLQVATIATPWSGLTLVSGFGSGQGAAFGERADELIARYGELAFAEVASTMGERVNLVLNEWDLVRPQLDALRS